MRSVLSNLSSIAVVSELKRRFREIHVAWDRNVLSSDEFPVCLLKTVWVLVTQFFDFLLFDDVLKGIVDLHYYLSTEHTLNPIGRVESAISLIKSFILYFDFFLFDYVPLNNFEKSLFPTHAFKNVPRILNVLVIQGSFKFPVLRLQVVVFIPSRSCRFILL